MRGVFITVRDKMPALAAHQCRKEPTGVGRPDHLGVLGKAEEGEPFTVARADEPVRLGLLEEGEESGCLLQIFRHDVTQCRDARCEILVLVLFFDTRGRSAGGECCGIKRERGWGEVRQWSGFLVLSILKGFCVFLRRGW
jgi:hypothetical protein